MLSSAWMAAASSASWLRPLRSCSEPEVSIWCTLTRIDEGPAGMPCLEAAESGTSESSSLKRSMLSSPLLPVLRMAREAAATPRFSAPTMKRSSWPEAILRVRSFSMRCLCSGAVTSADITRKESKSAWLAQRSSRHATCGQAAKAREMPAESPAESPPSTSMVDEPPTAEGRTVDVAECLRHMVARALPRSAALLTGHTRLAEAGRAKICAAGMALRARAATARSSRGSSLFSSSHFAETEDKLVEKGRATSTTSCMLYWRAGRREEAGRALMRSSSGLPKKSASSTGTTSTLSAVSPASVSPRAAMGTMHVCSRRPIVKVTVACSPSSDCTVTLALVVTIPEPDEYATTTPENSRPMRSSSAAESTSSCAHSQKRASCAFDWEDSSCTIVMPAGIEMPCCSPSALLIC